MPEKLRKLFEDHFKEKVVDLNPLPAHGSNREYFRLSNDKRSVIGAKNRDRLENDAFVSFSRHFLAKDLDVPEIYAEDLDQDIYLQQDLGDITLFDYLLEAREGRKDFPEGLYKTYEQVVELLPQFQIKGGQGLDYGKSYPHHSFDRQSMMWDLNYFKYYFLKLAHIRFNEQKAGTRFSNIYRLPASG